MRIIKSCRDESCPQGRWGGSRRGHGFTLRALALGVALVASWPAQGQAGVWASWGPRGERVESLALVAPATLYAGTHTGGVFRSTDDGLTWSAMGLDDLIVTSLAFDPATRTTVYAGTIRYRPFPAPSEGQVFKSTDSGLTWTTGEWAGREVLCLALDPAVTTTVYAGTESGGAFKSTDAGATWESILPDTTVHALTLAPWGTLYAATWSGLWKSTDAGSTWVNLGLAEYGVSAIVSAPSAPATLYAGVGDGVLRSTDGGASWSRAGLDRREVVRLTMPPGQPQTLYAVTWGGAGFRSTDAGSTWSPFGPAEGVTRFAVDPAQPSRVYAGTPAAAGGFFLSEDAGATWMRHDTGLGGAQDVTALAVDRLARATLYAATRRSTDAAIRLTSDVFRSTDAGRTWSPPGAQGLPADEVHALLVHPGLGSTLYAATGAGVFTSTDSGASWRSSEIKDDATALAADPQQPDTLYAGTRDRGVFKSTDAGTSWVSASIGLTRINARVSALAIDPTTSDTLYAGTAGGVYKSTNGGSSWAATTLTAPPRALAIDPSNAATLYAATTCWVYKSTDAGGTWTPLGWGCLPLPGGSGIPSYDSLAIDPSDPSTLFVGTLRFGVARSTDAGLTWSSINAGLRNTFVQALAMDPTGGSLYAGLSEGSVWRLRAPPPKGDLDGDGRPGLLLRSLHDGTRYQAWFMDGVARIGEADLDPPTESADWHLRGVADFDADGRNDLVFRNRLTGRVEFWLLDRVARGSPPAALSGALAPEPSWDLAATADFNRDGWPDLLWHHPGSRELAVWTMKGTRRTGEIIPVPSQAEDPNWTVVAAMDFSGDGNPDFLWYNLASGKLVTWYMDAGLTRLSGQFVTPPAAGNGNWQALASADYSGSLGPGLPPLGSPDIVWRNTTSGSQVVWHMDFNSTKVHGEFTRPAAPADPLAWTIVGPR